jgi:uncharacterized protein (DUF2147 family)
VRREALAAALLGLLLAAPAWGADPTGRWWAEGGAAQVQIEPCGDALCGRIVWLRSPYDPDGCLARDTHNPEARLRRRSLVGVEMLQSLRRSEDDPEAWEGGEVYDPTSGHTYRAALRMDGPDRLRLRGYLGIRLLGRTTTWTRVGHERECRDDASVAATPG